MNDEEKLLWILSYVTTIFVQDTSPRVVADQAVTDFRAAENAEHFDPPEDFDDEDLPPWAWERD
jgi:hypothetical protein